MVLVADNITGYAYFVDYEGGVMVTTKPGRLTGTIAECAANSFSLSSTVGFTYTLETGVCEFKKVYSTAIILLHKHWQAPNKSRLC
jgi:hypothetical protein